MTASAVSYYTLFASPIGTIGVVWSVRGIATVQLPERDERDTRSRMLRRFPRALESSPPPAIQESIDAMLALLRGDDADFARVELDWERVQPFNRKVYEIVRAIPRAQTLTYGDVADRLGDRELARDVGKALGQNPFPIVIPCHRVLAARGLGGFSASGGAETKMRILSIEGAEVGGQLALPLI